ncbi:MAG: serine hydrolase domain-containing protein, partial [Nocardioides sp.]
MLERLWPLVEDFVDFHEVAGLAVGVVRDGGLVARGFGVRDVRTGDPVTPETMFHLASVSKPFVATAVVSLTLGNEYDDPLDLDAPITEWVPELSLADGRAEEVTIRGLLSHTSGLPDVSDYGWHDPQLGDDAPSEFARSLSGWRLQSDPGTAFSYSNAGFELLGLLLSRAIGTTFEAAIRQRLLVPLGMNSSTFLRADVPVDLAAPPHVGMPLKVPDDAYPYSRRHAPSSTLHSNVIEMCRLVQAVLAAGEDDSARATGAPPWLNPHLLDLMWRPVVTVDRPPWEEAVGLGWSVGSYRGHRVLSHSGADPGFGSKLVLLPEQQTGVVLLANSNTVPTGPLAMAALDVAFADSPASGDAGEGMAAVRSLTPSVVGPVACTLAESGPEAAETTYRLLAAAEPLQHDLDDEGFTDVVWGAIELHRTDMVWPLLRLWTELRPDSS